MHLCDETLPHIEVIPQAQPHLSIFKESPSNKHEDKEYKIGEDEVIHSTEKTCLYMYRRIIQTIKLQEEKIEEFKEQEILSMH